MNHSSFKHGRCRGLLSCLSRPLAAMLLAATLAFMSFAALLASPSSAYATTRSEYEASHSGFSEALESGDTDAYADEDSPWYLEDSESTKDIDDDDLMSATRCEFDIWNLNFGGMMSDFVYSLTAPIGYYLSSLADDFLNTIRTGDLFTDVFTSSSGSGTYASAMTLVLNISNSIVVPVANGFLGIAFIFALMNFGRDAGMGRQHGTDLFAGYMWIAVKFVLISTCISHSIDIMQGIFDLVNYVGEHLQDLPGMGDIETTAVTSAIMNSYRSLTYSQGAGGAFLLIIPSLVCCVVAALTAIYVQVLIVVRVFEICILMAFSGFSFVMLGNQSTRESGMRYIKRFGGVCVQALVLAVVVGMGSVFMTASASVFTAAAEGLVGMLMNAISSIIGCIVLFLMAKQSRDIANAIVGL